MVEQRGEGEVRRPPRQIQRDPRQYREPGDPEGAAGSSYVDIPVQLDGRLKDGKEFHSLGSMTLRRVNDVDGSTAEQRKWHIYKADFPA